MSGDTDKPNGGAMTLEAVEPKPEIKTVTYWVLRRDPDTVPSVTRWIEEEPLSGQGEYGFPPGASEIGEAYGEGDYLLIRADGYMRTTAFSVVADKVYRQVLEDGDE